MPKETFSTTVRPQTATSSQDLYLEVQDPVDGSTQLVKLTDGAGSSSDDAMWVPSPKPTPEVAGPPASAVLPADSAERKRIPMCTGLLDYFPAALAEVAKVSWEGNEKHNPGQPLHWSRGKSADHPDCILRHLLERGGWDGKIRHSAALAWRALALLQLELEAEGAPLPRGAWTDE